MPALTKEQFLSWLEDSMELFQPNNSLYYADLNEDGQCVFKQHAALQVPCHLPQDMMQVRDVSGEAFRVLFCMNTDLVKPDFEEALVFVQIVTGCFIHAEIWCLHLMN